MVLSCAMVCVLVAGELRFNFSSSDLLHLSFFNQPQPESGYRRAGRCFRDDALMDATTWASLGHHKTLEAATTSREWRASTFCDLRQLRMLKQFNSGPA